jgi:hypothetical protein
VEERLPCKCEAEVIPSPEKQQQQQVLKDILHACMVQARKRCTLELRQEDLEYKNSLSYVLSFKGSQGT